VRVLVRQQLRSLTADQRLLAEARDHVSCSIRSLTSLFGLEGWEAEVRPILQDLDRLYERLDALLTRENRGIEIREPMLRCGGIPYEAGMGPPPG